MVWVEIVHNEVCALFSALMPGFFVTIRRNLLSVLFPTLTLWAIYADWSRTQRYKANKAKKLEAAQHSVL